MAAWSLPKDSESRDNPDLQGNLDLLALLAILAALDFLDRLSPRQNPKVIAP